MRKLITALAVFVLVLFPSTGVSADWLCEGDPLSIEVISGAVDVTGLAEAIPNTVAGTLPGDLIRLRWRGMSLQLPRTNNAGRPSYTDGRWWWREEDPHHPEFKERRGEVIEYICEPLG